MCDEIYYYNDNDNDCDDDNNYDDDDYGYDHDDYDDDYDNYNDDGNDDTHNHNSNCCICSNTQKGGSMRKVSYFGPQGQETAIKYELIISQTSLCVSALYQTYM